MTGHLAMVTASFHEKPAILVIFAVTYIGIAMGHVPGLKLNRVGIALLGAIAMMIFGSISNIIVVQQARALGIRISFGDFARLGLPVTLAALAGLLAWIALVA